MITMEALMAVEPKLWSIARRMHGIIDAEDLHSEAVVALVAESGSYDIPAVAVTVARRRMIDALRHALRHREHYLRERVVFSSLELEVEAGLHVEDGADEFERSDAIEMLSHLPAREAAVLYRRFFLDEGVAEIALSLGVSACRISQLTAAGLKRLRASLEVVS